MRTPFSLQWTDGERVQQRFLTFSGPTEVPDVFWPPKRKKRATKSGGGIDNHDEPRCQDRKSSSDSTTSAASETETVGQPAPEDGGSTPTTDVENESPSNEADSAVPTAERTPVLAGDTSGTSGDSRGIAFPETAKSSKWTNRLRKRRKRHSPGDV